MAAPKRTRAKRTAKPPAEGERAAVVGLGGQYHLAARVVRAKLATLEWIRVADPNAGIADDFQFHAGPTRYALQVRWAQYPASFRWAELANPSGEEPSLLAKLAQAWQRIRADWNGPLEVHLRSNEYPAATTPAKGTPLAACTASGPRHFAAFIARSFTPVRDHLRRGARRWAEVEHLDEVTQWQAAWDVLRTQSALDADTFAAFASDLALHFGPPVDDRLLRPDDAPEEAEIGHLAATLQTLVADPARPVQLSRAELLDRLGWSDRLQYRHPHAFPVPTIYTANEAARRDLQDRLQVLVGGYIGLVGPAGAGKSTLLASLTWPDRRVVRYYAFVPDASDPLSGRGEADSFLHDITLGLNEAGLPRLGYGNDLRSQRAILAEQLDQAGKRWRDHGDATVIVVDGLDHIPREQHPSRSLLDELPAPTALPDGVFVILGTQTTAILPAPVRDALSVEDRIVDLPPLSAAEVLHLADATGPGDWLLPGQRERLVTASEGHPLALTYLLEELTALEVGEPDIEARTVAADRCLNDASTYGREVQARYRGYLLAAGDDPELLDLLAAVARLRAPVDLDWLKTWVSPHILDTFVLRTSTFFRRDGTVWRFIHNSFRRFLVEETARVADAFDATRDRGFHVDLAEVCATSPTRWSLYRDEELAHRFLAGQHDRVIALATPPLLRGKLLDLRPPPAVRDHALLALRSAAATDDHATYVRMLLFLNELWQREYVLDPPKLATAMIKLGPPERAVEHLVAGGRLRVPAGTALSGAAGLARAGHSDAAAQILRAVGSLTDLVHHQRQTGGRDTVSAVADWAEASFHLSGVNAVLAQLDDQLPLPIGTAPDSTNAETPEDDEAKLAAERRQRDHAERNATVIACRNHVMARCFDLLTDVRDDAQLTVLVDRIDAEASAGWRARGRVVRASAAYEDGDRDAVLRWARDVIEIDSAGPDADEEPDAEEDTRPGPAGSVPLNLRLDTADLLIRGGFLSAPEIDQLIPSGTAAVWPSVPSGQDGLTPFLTMIDLWRLRGLRPDEHRGTRPDDNEARPLKAGDRRFRDALRLLADLEARQLVATIGHGTPPNVVGEADPIIRLLEVPERQTRDWTGWYYVRDAARGLFRRLVRLAAYDGPHRPAQLLDKFADAWTNADRAPYWSPRLQQSVLGAILEVDDVRVAERVREHLERIDRDIAERAWGPHDRAETWLTQADMWRRARNYQKADQSLRAAVRASLGPGTHNDDRQLTAWLEWLHAAAESGTVNRDELISTSLAYANRLAAADDADRDTAEAAARLVDLVWAADPDVSTYVAEKLCNAGVLDEVDAIKAVLLGAARDARIPVTLVSLAGAELLIPLLTDPSSTLAREVERRQDPETSHALATLAHAESVWSAPELGDDDPSSTPPPSGHEQPTPAPAATTAPALLALMRATINTNSKSDSEWAKAVDAVGDGHITPPVAKALLDEASRLRLRGESLGGIAAMAARAGQADHAAEVLTAELARTPAWGWMRHYDGGSRLKIFRAALGHRDPTLVRLAANDLAGALTTGGISGQIFPEDLRRITQIIGGPDSVARSWPDITAYLDIYAPATTDGPSDDDITVRCGSAAESLLRWVSGFLGHPVRHLDFGARRVLHGALECTPADAQRVLADAIHARGWIAEAALHTLVTAPHTIPNLTTELAKEISTAMLSDDAVSRDLARRVASRYSLPISLPPARPLPDTYRLALPPLPERIPPKTDAEGVPHLDMHDPQQLVAPFDFPMRLLAQQAALDEESVLHRGAAIAAGLDLPWIRGGHHEHAKRLKVRGQRHSYRPWAFMAGRRALGVVLAELLDSGVLGTPPPFPAYYLGLVDEVLIHVKPTPLDTSNPPPWRRPGTSLYDVRSWCDETNEAAHAYASAISDAPTYVLAEDSEWCNLERGKPKETRTIRAAHGHKAPADLLLPLRQTSEWTYTPASGYPDLAAEWADQQLVVHGWEGSTDPPYFKWLALHPAVADQLGWRPDDEELFAWRGDDGAWRARTARRVRGQLAHDAFAHTYCAEVWQVILSNAGLAELSEAFGPIRRRLTLKRELPAQPSDGRALAQRARAQVGITESA